MYYNRYTWNDENRVIADGIYDVSGLEYHFVQAEGADRINAESREFIDKHNGDVWVGAAYGAYGVFIFAGEPRDIEDHAVNGQFNYGCNALVGCDGATSIFICAEND